MAKKSAGVNVAVLLQDLADAVSTAKQKADTVDDLRTSLASYTAEKQAEIDTATAEYTDAKIAAERLQEQARELIGTILPAPDPRFRVTT